MDRQDRWTHAAAATLALAGLSWFLFEKGWRLKT